MRAAVFLVLLALPCACYAVEEIGTMKCKNGKIEAGTSKADVVKRCGQPSTRNDIPDLPLAMGKEAFKATQEWGYKIGRQDYVVMINGDVVVKLFQEQR